MPVFRMSLVLLLFLLAVTLVSLVSAQSDTPPDCTNDPKACEKWVDAQATHIAVLESQVEDLGETPVAWPKS